jgi:adenylyl-sulfate kinase
MSFTLWFMGLPASGKSTLAKRVENRLRDDGIRIENLDGDEIRKNLHPDLGFTREEREINNRRTAFISKLLNRNGIATVTGMITPFRDSQAKVREIIEPTGRFVLIYVKCSVETCAERDPKGLYEQAKDGKIDNFTGVNHPFQEPLDPDVIVDTEESDVETCVQHILKRLEELDVYEQDTAEKYGFDVSRGEESEIVDELQDRGYLHDA